VTFDRLAQVDQIAIHRGGHVVERETQAPESQDPVETAQIVYRIEPVTRARAFGRDEQPHLFVVVERPYRDSRERRELTDLPAPVLCHFTSCGGT
jgi:hypothetical protein